MKTKVLKITESYFPNDVRVLKQALAYRDSNIEVFVIAMNNGQQKAFECYEGINVYRLPISMKKGNVLSYLYEYIYFFIKSMYKVHEINKKHKIDVVHVHTIPDFLVFASLPAKLTGAKVIIDLAEVMPEFFSFKFNVKINSLICKIMLFFELISVKYSDSCITITDRIKKIFESRTGAKNISVIMNTIECKGVTTKISNNKNSDPFVMISHGHINAAYDYITCIKAVKSIIKKIPNFRFYIYGDGPFIDKCKEKVSELKIENIVEFKGWVSRDEVYEAIKKSNIGIIPAKVNPYLNITFSNKLGDYAALGKPIICPFLEGYHDYFPINTIAYLKSFDPDSICEKVYELYNNNEYYNEMSYTCIKIYSNIDWSIMKKRLIANFNGLLTKD